MKNPAFVVALSAVLSTSFIATAQADKLDDIIGSGKLRCAVTLDFPPMGFRDASNKPVGFDVDYCNDLAKILGVEAEVVETPFPDRIPALVSGRADVIVASTSDTLERAKTVGLTVPYFAFQMVVLTRDNTGINSFDDIKGKALGNTSGTYEAIALEKDVKQWGSGSFRAYQSQNDTLLAVAQGHIDATVSQWVLAGEPVGQMGPERAGSARDSKPRLYIELRRNGRSINPLPWLAGR